MMTSKIHRTAVTQADLHDVGSVTVDADLPGAVDVLPGLLGIIGAAARLVHPGDITENPYVSR